MKNLRAIFGLLNDMSFDTARLDTLERSRENLRGISLELADRACTGIEGEIESEFRRLGKMLNFRVEKIGHEVEREVA